MDLILIFLLVAIACVLASSTYSYILKHKRNISKNNKEAPQAGGALPVIGHLQLIGASGLPHKTLAAMADKYGPIFTIRLGINKAMVVSSWEMARECLHVNDKAASGRPNKVAAELIGYNYAMFGFGTYGPYWRYMRRIVMQELLSNHRLKMLSHVWRSEVKLFTRNLYDGWSISKGSSNMMGVDMKKLFGDLTMNIIVKIISGDELGIDSEEMVQFKQATRDSFQQFGSFATGDALPFLRWLDLGGQEKAMKKTFKQLDKIVQRWLEEHKRKRSLDDTKGNSDFMDVMLSIVDDDATKDCNYDADTVNKSTCLMMVLAGTDTTTVTLTWALSLLLNNRKVMVKAKKELEDKVGKERQVSASDIPSLAYLQAIVKETLRLYPPAPLLGPREFIENCNVGGYHVGAGTWLFVNLYKMFRDPRIWEDPSEFRPERFLTTNKDLNMGGQSFEFIPFGAGRRICPGISFALQVTHLALASFLHAFEFSTPCNASVDMSETFGLTNQKTEPLEVLVAPTLCADAYTWK